MKLGERTIAPDQPPYIIAELGVNHDGSVDRALELVQAAVAARADAIKLQLFETDLLLSKAAKLAAYQVDAGATDPFAMLRALELSIDQMRPIVDCAHRAGLHAIVTVFSLSLVTPAQSLSWDAYKTASPDIIHLPLLEALRATTRPLIVSTGAASHDEVRQATKWLGTHPHILMQCVSSYPTPDDYASLAGREAMARESPSALGYSDHTAGIDTGALAVAAGARMLEKHLTYDCQATGPDHAASLEPAAFAEYIRLSHRAFRMLGETHKAVQKIEQDVRSVSRQSITTTRSLASGHRLTSEDLTVKRPGTGIAPHRLAGLVGRTLARPVEADMPLMESDLA